MSSKVRSRVDGKEETARSLAQIIEDERKKLDDISLAELSRPEVIARQQAFDKAVVAFMRSRLAGETGRGE